MSFKAINDQLSVSPQIHTENLAGLAQQGFRSVICNRPDGEAADQPTFEEIETAARKVGLEIRYQPIVAGRIRAEDLADFGDLLNVLPKPILAYCRTGARSTTLWSLFRAELLSGADS